jgi:hypothetical protein
MLQEFDGRSLRPVHFWPLHAAAAIHQHGRDERHVALRGEERQRLQDPILKDGEVPCRQSWNDAPIAIGHAHVKRHQVHAGPKSWRA